MKIKDGYLLDSIGEQKVAVALDHRDDKFTGLIKLNEVGAFLWEQLQVDISEEQLVQAVTDNYEVDHEKAAQDVTKFLAKLRKHGILESGR